jgi:putative ABC transport system permease protein
VIRLLRLFAWRPLRRRPLRTLLGAASVALGVALFVSADVANTTVLRAFEETGERVGGRAKLRVTFASGAGVDEAALARIESVPGVVAAPVLQRSATLAELKDGPVLVLGVDFWKDRLLRLYDFKIPERDLAGFAAAAFRPDGVVITRRFASRHGLAAGSPLVLDTPGGRARLAVTGVLEDEGPARVFGGNFLVMGLPTAQRLFTKPGIVDQVDVAPAEGADREKLRKRLEEALGPAYSVQPILRKSAVLEDALSRVRSLVIVSVVALVVGLFIVYNSVSVSVVERLRDLAILRSVGALRRQVLSLVLVEWTVIGFAGSLAGLAAGYGISRFLIALSAKSANALMLSIDVREVVLTSTTAVASVVVGTGVSFLAALVPAREAMRVPPAGLMSEAATPGRDAPRYLRSFFAGVALIAAASVLVLGFYLALPAYGGLAATVLIFVGVALVLPQITIWTARIARPGLRRLLGIEGTLAADHVAKFPARTALTTIALGGALSMMVASQSFLASLKNSADAWMAEAFPFDLSISGTDMSTQLYSPARFPDSLAARAAAVPGVKSVYTVAMHHQPYRDQEVLIFAIDIEGLYRMHVDKGVNDRMKSLRDPEFRARLVRGEDIVVSENFMNRYGASPGTSVELQTAVGPRSFRVAAAVEDYSWPSGVIVMEREAYRRLWKDDLFAYIDLRVDPAHPLHEVRSRLADELKGTHTAFIYSPDDLRRIASATLDQAFRLADVQVVIAVLIGFLGILNTLLISVLRRTREIGLLRAVGATRRQIRRTVAIESLLMAASAGAIGVAAGVAGAAFPLRLHTLQVTGYWIPLSIPWAWLAASFAGALLLGFVASLLPAARAARQNILEAIAYE